MNTSDLWMKLEALAHLRQLPSYGLIRKSIEDELAEYNDSLAPKPVEVPRPRSIPSADTTGNGRRA